MEIKKFEEFCLIIEEEDKKSYSGSHGGLDKWFKEKWVDISKTNKDGSHPHVVEKTHQRVDIQNVEKLGWLPKCLNLRKRNQLLEREGQKRWVRGVKDLQITQNNAFF